LVEIDLTGTVRDITLTKVLILSFSPMSTMSYLIGNTTSSEPDTSLGTMDASETEREDEIFMLVDRSSLSSSNTNYTFPSRTSNERVSSRSTISSTSEELSDHTALYYEGSASEYTSDEDEELSERQVYRLSPLSSSTVSTVVETSLSVFLSTPLISSDHPQQVNPLPCIAPGPCTGRSCQVKTKLHMYHHRMLVWTLPRSQPRGIHEKRFRIFLQDFYETVTKFTSWHKEDHERLKLVMHQIVEVLSVVLYTLPGSQSAFDKKRTDLAEKAYECFIDMHLLTLVDLEELRKQLIGKLSS
jgi:hypothetical protein